MLSIINPVWNFNPEPVGPVGGIAINAQSKHFGELCVALMLVDQNETARVGQAFNIAHRGDAAKSGEAASR